MRLVFEPTIYLIGRQVVESAALRPFLEAHGAPGWTTDAATAAETLCEIAGRVCYDSFASPRPGGNAAYVANLLAARHGSVLEHAVFSFILDGVSRSLTHELVRHRAGVSVSQLSQRFVDPSDVAFVVPPAMTADPDDDRFRRWLACVEECRDVCTTVAAAIQDERHGDAAARVPTAVRKAAREAARSVLPNATSTTIFVTANARALRHMLELRGSLHADAEFARLAVAWLAVARGAAPNLFSDMGVAEDDSGRRYITTRFPKV